jgi:hypothetical protein
MIVLRNPTDKSSSQHGVWKRSKTAPGCRCDECGEEFNQDGDCLKYTMFFPLTSNSVLMYAICENCHEHCEETDLSTGLPKCTADAMRVCERIAMVQK